jgi:hypothetical protein
VSVAYDIDGQCSHLVIPRLLLQPLVKNAYRHGVTTETDRLAIQVTARANAGRIMSQSPMTVQVRRMDSIWRRMRGPACATSGHAFGRSMVMMDSCR